MFTGIVREVGRVVDVDGGEAGRTLVVEAPATAATTAVGDSVAIGGVCLTAEARRGGPHPLPRRRRDPPADEPRRARRGHDVNVEPALRAGEPLGGHYVQGHVDGLGAIGSVEAEGDGLRVVVEAPPEILRYCVEKGSITVDGVSLTVSELLDDAFAVALVPHTLAATTLARPRARTDGEPRGRRAREVRRAARGAGVTMTR